MDLFSFDFIVACIGSLLIAFAWMFFLRRIDFFETESWGRLSLVFGLGTLTVPLIFLIQTLFPDLFTEDYSYADFEGILKYMFLQVAGPEELVKILPLLIAILLFPNLRQEPSNFLIYGAMGALGFSMVENVLYAVGYGGQVILMRSVISVFIHVACTTSLSYGIWYFFFHRRDGMGLMTFLACIFGGLAGHAIFNTLNLYVPPKEHGYIYLLRDIPLLVLVEVWTIMMNNTINMSPKFRKDKALDRDVLRRVLVALMSVATIVIALPFFTDPEGFATLIYQGTVLILLVFVMSIRMVRMVLIPGYTRYVIPSLPFRYAMYDDDLPQVQGRWVMNGLPFNEAPFTNKIGKEVDIHPLHQHTSQIGSYARVILTDKKYIGYQTIVYAVDFSHADDPMSKNEYYYLMPKFSGQTHSGDYPILGLLAMDEPIDSEDFNNEKPRFLGWVVWHEINEKSLWELFVDYLK